MTFTEFADAHGWTLSAVATGPREGWPEDSCSFQVSINGPSGVVWSGPYTVGGYYPLAWAKNAMPCSRADKLWRSYVSQGGTLDPRRLCVNADEIRMRIVKLYRETAPLNIGDILESVQADLSSIDQPFDDWCADLGLDTDSRKALATYETLRDQFFAFREACDLNTFLEIEA